MLVQAVPGDELPITTSAYVLDSLVIDDFECALWKPLTHWGRVTHICISKQTIIGSDNGLSPVRRQAIIWTNAGLLLIGTLGTNFSEIVIKIRILSFKKMGLKVSSAKWRPFCLGLNVLNVSQPLRTCPTISLIIIKGDDVILWLKWMFIVFNNMV